MELYPENLDSLKALLELVGGVSAIDGVFEVEIRVRLDDADEWAVLGFGEAGDPCVLRFEKTNQPVAAFPFPHPIGPGIRGPGVGITTINKLADPA